MPLAMPCKHGLLINASFLVSADCIIQPDLNAAIARTKITTGMTKTIMLFFFISLANVANLGRRSRTEHLLVRHPSCHHSGKLGVKCHSPAPTRQRVVSRANDSNLSFPLFPTLTLMMAATGRTQPSQSPSPRFANVFPDSSQTKRADHTTNGRTAVA